MSLTAEKRAFVAGCIISNLKYQHRIAEQAEIPAMVGECYQKNPAPIDEEFAKYVAYDELHQAAQAAKEGVNLSKSIREWQPPELNAAVTAMSMYEGYLKRELRKCQEVLALPGIQTNPQYNYSAIAAYCLASEQNVQVDPVWSAKFLRRLHSEQPDFVVAK